VHIAATLLLLILLLILLIILLRNVDARATCTARLQPGRSRRRLQSSIADLELANLVAVIGSSTTESHPVIAARMKRAQAASGVRGGKYAAEDTDNTDHPCAGLCDPWQNGPLHSRPANSA
jgi:hypothetical protein